MKSLEAERKKNHMTQEALASRIGVNRTTVTKWETGQAVPSLKNLRKIARLFCCTLDELVAETEEQKHV